MEMLDVQDRTAIPLECEGRWAPERVWTIWRRQQSLAFVGVTTTSHPAYCLSTIPTELSRLPFCISLKLSCQICIPQFNKIFHTNYNLHILKTTVPIIQQCVSLSIWYWVTLFINCHTK